MRIYIMLNVVLFLVYTSLAMPTVQSISEKMAKQVRHLSQDEITRRYNSAYEKLQKTNPAQLAEFKVLPKPSENAIGDTVEFNMLDYSTNNFYKLRAVLKAKGDHTQIWVDVLSLDSSFVNNTVINQILTTLESKTDDSSIDPNNGIYEIDVATFGNPPNYDGDGLVDFLVTDIRDGLEDSNTYVAGFFSSWDQGNRAGSNKRDILYIDSKQGIYQDGKYNTYTVMGTVAHEFQHLIHYKQDSDEVTFINEAMSELAGTLCGYGLSYPGYFFDDPNKDLTRFDNELKDYASVNLWSVYIYEQFGINFIRNFVANEMNGKSGFNNTLSNMGIATDFDKVFQHWTLCNYINDTTVNTKWGYLHQAARALQVSSTSPLFYPMTVNSNVVNYGSLYYKFSVGEKLKITVTSEYAYAKYIRKRAAGIEVIDLPIGTPYEDDDFGDTVSEGIVVIGSIKGNTSFSLIAEATSTVELVELSHDDGTPDAFTGSASFLYTQGTDKGWAVKFAQFESSTNQLTQIKINASTGIQDENSGELLSTEVLLHVWGDNGGQPGSDLVTPALYELNSGWNTINCSDVFGQDITLPSVYYIGFTNPDDQTAVAVGMDNSQSTNFTWVITSEEIHPLSSVQLSDGTPLAGFNMMMRAVISIPYIDTRATFSVGLAQNPIFSENLDIYIFGNKRLDETSLTAQATIAGTTKDLNLVMSGTTNKVFVDNSYVLNHEGNLEISIQGKNTGSSLDAADTTMQIANVALSKTNRLTQLASPDNKLNLFIPANDINSGEYILLMQDNAERYDATVRKEETFYRVISTKTVLTQPARVVVTIPPGKSARVAILEENGWKYLPVELQGDLQSPEAVLHTSKLGTFRIEMVDADQPNLVIHAYRLEQNYPNPFNPETEIIFAIKDPGLATLTIYNILGQRVKTLLESYLNPSVYTFTWDGTNDRGVHLPTGIYIYQLHINGYVFTKKMSLIR